MLSEFKKGLALLRLLGEAYSPYRRNAVVLTVLGFVSGLLEGVGVNALIPFLAIITGSASGGADPVSQALAWMFNAVGLDFSLKYILVLIILLFVLKAAVLLLFNYIKIRITTSYERTTRSALFRDLLRAEWPYLLTQKVGHFETVIMTNVRSASELLWHVSDVLILAAGLLIYAAVAVNISPRITLVTLVSGGILFVALRPLLTRTRKAARGTEAANKTIAHFINESILGMKSLKAAVVNEPVAEKATSVFSDLARLRMRTLLLRSISGSVLQPISLVFVAIVFAISYKLPGFEFVAFVPVVYLIQRIFSYVQQLQGYLTRIVEAGPYVKHVLEYQKEANRHRERTSGTNPFLYNTAIQFEDVSFAYTPEQMILHNVSFTLPKGKMTAIVGSSGGGKTTITDLLLRLLSPTSGAIVIDGTPIDDIDIKEWRRAIGYVSQDLFLLNDTIAANIRFYDESITDAELEKVAKMAHIYDFIQSCPLGFETPVGERGILLSAGQRQRIVIARALARDPQVLILDEATSALDNESEAQIQRVIEELRGHVTVLVIAHRLALIENADTVIVVERGKIIEEGNPSQLRADPQSAFFKLHNAHA